MDDLLELVIKFRLRIETALKLGLLDNDIVFNHFPRGCCGDTCYLLAEFLLKHGIETLYVCGTYKQQSHAWLVVKDDHITPPSVETYVIPDEIKQLLESYGETVNATGYSTPTYKAENLIDGLIIDITADQFGENPVYVGASDKFHRQFDFDFAHDLQSLYNDNNNPTNFRLQNLYKIITSNESK